MAKNLATSLQDLLLDFLKPLDEAGRNPQALIDWLEALGHTRALSGHPTLLQIAQHARSVISKLAAFDAEALESTNGLISVVSCGREVAAILQDLQTFADDPARSQFAQGLAEDVMSFLLASLLRRRFPTAFRIASLLTLIEPRETTAMDPAIVANGTTLRYGRVMDRFRFASVGDLLQRPGGTLKAFYLPNDLTQGADAWLAVHRLFPNVAFLADSLGLGWRLDSRSTAPAPSAVESDPNEEIPDSETDPDPEGPPEAEVVEDTILPAPVPVPDEYYAASYPVFRLGIAGDEASNAIALEILASSLSHPGGVAGFILALTGDFNRTETRGSWKLTFSSSGAIPALAVGPAGFARVAEDHPVASGTAKLLIERLPDPGSTGPAFVLGSPKGTRLEIGNLNLNVDVAFDPAQWSALIGLNGNSGALVLAAGDGDSFLSSVLPAEGLRADFDLGLEWSDERGLTLRGSTALEATLPIGVSIGGVVTVPTIYLGVRADNSGIEVEISAGVGVSIGPVHGLIERIGIAAAVRFPETGGNLGIADLDFHFKPPSGLGLAIDAPAIVGGGYLSFDPEKGEYGGVLQVEIVNKISVKAFGLLSTKLPDGVPGYALIVFITAEDFQPIQLGMGFKLEGIGGMFAVNRTFDEVATREGLKNNTLATLLFPHDPVANAPQILRNLSTVFPIKPGSYLFGPMAKIGWATPTLITMDLALILEFGLRRRLIVLGRISSMLPNRDEDLIRLNMDAMGVLDMDVGTLALDAVLVDSRLLQKFVLTGSMAMRACLVPGPQAGLCLAVGGVNPHFTPPANMPKLDRITINLTSGDNPRFVCDGYFAVTANTQQFGSRSSLYAAAYGFSIEGEVSFDVLMRLLPFHFIADFLASIQLKHGSSNLFKVKVEGELDGPLPLHLTAKATFEILCCDYSVHFDKTLFAGDKLPLPPAVDALEELKRALSSPDNWSAQIPVARQHGVTTRKLAANAPLALDPLGQLSVTQSVLPLNTNRDIDTFGGAPISGARRFTITASLNSSQAVEPVQDMFAPAQFFDLSDDERLASPSFEMMDNGVVFGSNAVSIEESPAQRVYAPLKYDTIVVYADGTEEIPPDDYVLGADRLLLQAQLAFVAKASIRTTGLRKFSNTRVAPAVKLANPGWRIVSTSDLNTTVPAFFEISADASASVKALNQRDAADAVSWQLIPAYETSF